MVTLSAHRAIEMVVGTALIVLPFALAAEAGGTIVCVVLGAAIVTLALSADREGRALAGRGHEGMDRLLAAVLAVVAVVLAITSDAGLAVGCAIAAIVQILLSLVTRYSVRPGRDEESQATTVSAS
jgi:hypothetical protein